ncbi:HlyD family efflux transporter periplasmic adaptor subunit [Dissulfurirhabdus thermomarina]|uniref:HlyD family efflux transporter periplasmic adaptor subunit n=1 Tax=Dissulfurirhabdus thermomarina TaxID=1765737 RepID=A0A6N9TQ19_DISTH|nr:efflux RND transporter periplasmic adaptor subunit [Dissulfurirhabdus thermomarina]NDY42203.1 HlyD family efflux transporter periplasmic adaptor subunit [Dissulfurirhabdus thermomarina]NMX22669.1 HlyD family efflux transporter periplasmic adaptor subunit [Dissulfurirhabdus thermomarina]
MNLQRIKKTFQANGRRIATWVLVAAAVALAAGAVRFVLHRMAYAVTDAVFVRTDSLTPVAFDRVSGRIARVLKREGDLVRAGEALALLDDTVYRLAVKRLAAELAGAEAEKAAQETRLARIRKAVDLAVRIAQGRVTELSRREAALRARVAAIDAEIEQLARDRARFDALLEAEVVARRRAEDVATRLKARRAERRAAAAEAEAVRAAMATARREVQRAENERLQVREAEKALQALEEKVKALTAALAAARDDLAQCVLKSPMDGRVAKRYLAAGAQASPKRAVFALVDPRDLYVVALLEENKLRGVTPGAPAVVRIDAFPGETYRGEVEAVLPASAATFALAPRDISAGEFTKVAQRIPVRIRLTGGDLSRLRVGLGGEVEIRRR